MYTFFTQDESQYIFPCIERKINILKLHSLFSRASGRYFSLQIIPLPRADAIVSYGVRSAVIYVGSTDIDVIATRDKIGFITVKRDLKNPLSSRIGDFYCEFSKSDLQYFEKRYYDPRIGRFTTEDPVFWEVGLTQRPAQYFTDPQQWNTYSYVRNNPINLVDPTGEYAIQGAKIIIVGTLSYCDSCKAAATTLLVGAGVIASGVADMAEDAYESVSNSLSNISSTKGNTDTTTVNNNTNQQSNPGDTKSGAGQTAPQSGASSPPPNGNGGNKNGKDDKGTNRGNNRNTNTTKDYEQIAKEKGMTETKQFGKSHGEKIYKLGNKYYSPESTAHNTDMGWKVFKRSGGGLKRIGTTDKNLNNFKK